MKKNQIARGIRCLSITGEGHLGLLLLKSALEKGRQKVLLPFRVSEKCLSVENALVHVLKLSPSI
jgi:hypothetical protein